MAGARLSSPPLRVTYVVRAPGDEIERRVERLILEQTVELPRGALRDADVVERVVGQVESIAMDDSGSYRVVIAQPLVTSASDPAQLLNVLFGNSSLQPDVTLVDVDLPFEAVEWLPGPRAGIPGLRALARVPARPLLATALKPMGLAPEQLGSLCRTFARAGLDIIKDDHGLADHPFCPFEARVEACLRATEQAANDTGRRALYVPNLIGSPDRISRQLAFAREAGALAAMVSPLLIGLPTLRQLASAPDGLPLLAHPSLGGLLRAGEPVLFGKLFRWYGADAVIFPHAGGRFSFSSETCRRLAQELRAPHTAVRPSFPVPAGGMRIERVSELLSFYGSDCILLIGGDLYEAGDALFETARGLVDRVSRASEERLA